MNGHTLSLNGHKGTPMPIVAKDREELFPQSGFRMWKKGEVANPTWLQRENGHDFCIIKTEKNLQDFIRYLGGDDQRLAVRPYNCFSTALDRNGKDMLMLIDMDENATQSRVCIALVLDQALTNRAIGAVDHHCGAPPVIDSALFQQAQNMRGGVILVNIDRPKHLMRIS
jgi:hypothetical protein